METVREQFVHLADVTHDQALVAWGAFYFSDDDEDGVGWRIVRDDQLAGRGAGARSGSIGQTSAPYGSAEVEVRTLDDDEVVARAATDAANHVWVEGLQPDSAYRYRVLVDGEPWAEGPLRAWRVGGDGPDLVETDRVYDMRFRTHPAPDTSAPLRFAVLGDYGAGILASEGNGNRQRRIAAALERAVDAAGVRLVLTTGDNVYVGAEGTVAGSGNADEDWYFSFYEPYRHTISRVPVYPGVGNHDTEETEASDDRAELEDNFFTRLRFAEHSDDARSSVDPGLFYRFEYGADIDFVCIDSTIASSMEHDYYVDHPRHRAFLEDVFGGTSDGWLLPFSHHPPYCAGPKHHNTEHLVEQVVPLLEQAGVRAMFSGHEHNFQHSRVRGVDYVLTGAAGKLREGRPDGFDEAGTLAWAAEGHLLVVDVEGDRMTIHPVTEVDETGRFTYLPLQDPDGQPVDTPIVLTRAD